MSKTPHEVADFVALPVHLQGLAAGKYVKHYLYVKAYEPKIPDAESPRALFLVNIPVTASEAQLRHLFAIQLSASHVQQVHFASNAPSTSSSALIATTNPANNDPPTKLGKRKRPTQLTSSDYEGKLASCSLPSTHPSAFHLTGSTAIAVFLDRTSRDQTLRACRKAAKSSKSIIWGAGLDAVRQPPLGRARYAAQRQLTFPPRAELLSKVDEYMTTYAALEEARSRESAKRRAEPDEDGFVTVTRGSKGVVKQDEAEAIKARLDEMKRKDKGVEDFYRFQMRERRKEEQGKLLRQFEEERKRVDEMRQQRKGLRPEG